jgi:hypothetical protein
MRARRDRPAEYAIVFHKPTIGRYKLRTDGDDDGSVSGDFFDIYNGVIMKLPAERRTYDIVKGAFEKQYFHLRLGGDTYGSYMRDGCGELYFQHYEETRLKSQNKNVYFWSKDSPDAKPKRKAFITAWIGDTFKRYYDRRDFIPPPLKCHGNVLNAFTGFAAADLPASGKAAGAVADGDVAPFLAHLSLLADGDARASAYLLSWFAQILQEPGKLSGTYVIFGGREGTGKSFLVSFVGEKLLGKQYFYKTDKADRDIFGRFANGRIDKLLLDFEEAKQLHEYYDNLKDLVTSTQAQYERKGAMSETVRVFNRVVMTTNNRFPVTVDSNDRRVVALWAADDKCNDRAHFKQLAAWCDDPVNVRLVYEYLMARDISEVDFIADRPVTAWCNDMKTRSLKISHQFLLALADEHGAAEATEISSADLMTRYLRWSAETNQRTALTATALGVDVRTAGGEHILIGAKRVRGFRLNWETIRANVRV